MSGYDINDKTKVRMAKRDARDYNERLNNGLKKILEDSETRFFLQVLLEQTGWNTDCETPVQEGKARIGRAIVSRMLSISPGAFSYFTNKEQNGNKKNDTRDDSDDIIFG